MTENQQLIMKELKRMSGYPDCIFSDEINLFTSNLERDILNELIKLNKITMISGIISVNI